jgi:hypothetical protein
MLDRSSCPEIFADEAAGRIPYTAWLNFGTERGAGATDVVKTLGIIETTFRDL